MFKITKDGKDIQKFEYSSYHFDDDSLFIDDVNDISDFAFAGNYSIRKVILSQNIGNVGIGVFNECKNIEEIKCFANLEFIPDYFCSRCFNLRHFSTKSNRLSIGKYAFENTKIEQVPCLEKVIGIDECAFSHCYKLNIDTLQSLDEIGQEAFRSCKDLAIQKIVDIKRINELAFLDCCNIVELNITSQKLDIDRFAFMHCNNLRQVTINADLLSINDGAFSQCISLEKIFLKIKQIDKLGDCIFNKCNKNLRIIGNTNIAGCFDYNLKCI